MALVLPEPSFINRNPAEISEEGVARYQDLTGKTLYPAQPERLMLDVLAYREILLRILFQEAAKQNLVQYATGAILEHHGRYFGVTRLPARKARTTLRFRADNEARASTGTVITIPAGTQVRTKDSKHSFVSLSDVILEMTDTFKDVEAEALDAGAGANNYPPNTVTELLTTIAFLESASNIRVTERGADLESDDQLRQRVIEAPESFSVAGSRQAYMFHAKSAHPSIIDVAVESRVPGTVQVYPLTVTGTPTSEVITDVETILRDERVRPLTDTVQVMKPVVKSFNINARVTLLQSAPAIETRAEILRRLSEYADIIKRRLGRDIVPTQIISRIQGVSGVYNVELLEPVGIVQVAEREFAQVGSTTLQLASPIAEEAL